ncbi:MAG: acyl transferase [Flavobacteriaceae bacterium]|nr:acyl transferase [Flavobacteriaceae bacterium]
MKVFEKNALNLFANQYATNTVYRSFCDLMNISPTDVHTIKEIPFLPISLFKSHRINCKEDTEIIFESSGTGGPISRHYVASLDLYNTSFNEGFREFYGAPTDYHILALLPSYLERPNASLVYMCRDLIRQAKPKYSGFYLNNFDELHAALQELNKKKEPTLLIGVSFALLDFCEAYPLELQHTIIMETGGMKGRRKELIREELHALLKKGFGVANIHSEYGMTELLSQAYSKGNGSFKSSSSMRVFIRDVNDPKNISETGAGGLNIIDLSNKNSCAFIATQDLGKCYADGTFEVLGRFDASDVRGCSLMTA